MGYTAIFDIGKTNKKCFVFDERLALVEQWYAELPETKDEDGEPCEDLPMLSQWIRDTFRQANEQYPVQKLNFTTYGASFVQLDKAGQTVAPLYNYLKSFPDSLHQQFFAQYGPEPQWARETASPSLGMLNSGVQLYWLTYARPETFAQLGTALHLPQYCSFLFDGQRQSDYTSIGCHTGLWDFGAERYHHWVEHEGIASKLAPIVPPHQKRSFVQGQQEIALGYGLHDSSAALIPYLRRETTPFLLLSTGTWSICLNPFSEGLLTDAELAQDCLYFMQQNGKTVKAARLFLGREYQLQNERLSQYFGQSLDFERSVRFDANLYQQVSQQRSRCFCWEVLPPQATEPQSTDLSLWDHVEAALHRLVYELVERQIMAIRLAEGQSNIRRILVDGGFAQNPLFINILQHRLPGYHIEAAGFANGTALGAAMAF